jgi:hypothetical protein
VRNPMPLVAPVITATLPSSRAMSFPLRYQSTTIFLPRADKASERFHCDHTVWTGLAVIDCPEIPRFRYARPYFGFADHVK